MKTDPLLRPKLMYNVGDSVFAQQLIQSPEFKAFIQVKVDADSDWVEQLKSDEYQVVVLDIESQHVQNEELHTCLAERLFENTEFIFLSHGLPNPVIDELMTQGAGYHFREPIELEAITDCLADMAEEFAEDIENHAQTRTSDLDQFGLLAGSSKIMRKLYRTIRKVAKNDINVFITGESGSGKELVANTIHLFSEVSDGPFVAVNCGAISPELVDSELFGHVKGAFTGAVKDHQGVFEQAQGGTLFLDEVTEMPLEHQVKLLRVLESGEYRPVGATQLKHANVRVIAASNRDPLQAIEEEVFREDLFYRLAQFPIAVPPLRLRDKDITGLAKHFLAYRNSHEMTNKQISPEALQKIASYSWPGNVRELKHTIERAFILCSETIEPQYIVLQQEQSNAGHWDGQVPTGMALEELEKQAILNTLDDNDGNKTETAEQLGVSVKTLYNKLEKYQKDED
ncbi:sigma-54 dependent transcriptional regulator [Planctobacterium marinum]